jgi:hypothetical protein
LLKALENLEAVRRLRSLAVTRDRPDGDGCTMFDTAMVIFGGALFALFLGYVAVCDLL